MKTTKKKSPKSVAPDTLIGAIEQIVNLAVEHKLTDEFYARAEQPLDYLAKRMNITWEQALVFALFVEKSSSYRIHISDIAHMQDCRVVRVISMMSEAEELVRRGFLRCHKCGEGEISYRMPIEVVNAVKDNRVYVPEPMSGLKQEQFYERLSDILEQQEFDSQDDTTSREAVLRELVQNNQQLPVCRVIKQLRLPSDNFYSFVLLCVFIHLFINNNDDCIYSSDWDDYVPRKFWVRNIVTALKNKSHILVQKNILEPCNEDGMSNNNSYHLTDYAKEQLFPELIIEPQNVQQNHLILHTSFAPKQLYYTPTVQTQIDQLVALLQPEHFKQVQSRLEAKGMRQGFACLFYGAPGTGKTETVNQLARMTGRDVMMVDVSQIKSCWVGESEKNIKAAFNRYRRCVASSANAPILLFNEADAVLGIRQEGAERAVDKMENSIQNIILQEMEQLDGIMIATTNLTQNLDKAFERRFIYKIEFERPTAEIRASIWQAMIPELTVDVARNLACQFDFSGGQIENIARKRTVEFILSGVEPTYEQLASYCRSEQLTTQTSPRRRIGF